MTFPADHPNLSGNAGTARFRRDLLVAGHNGRILTEAIGRPLIRAEQAAQSYRAAADRAALERRGAPSRRWLRVQAGLCHRRARIAADEAALAAEQNQPDQATTWATLADRYAKAARHLAHPVLDRATAIGKLRAAADALDPSALSPLSGIPLFSVDSGRQALANAQRGEGPVLMHVNAVAVELLLFACYAEGRAETGYHVATYAVRALDRARKSAPENQAEAMDPQALAVAFELTEQALDAAEAVTAPTP
ncbi:hypothetical protein ABT224_36125 [Streptomyces sp. NPDC001584]|uniref:hypothetical protein n=1 Tax=Streptomyces sp. NPDC001584 TaxID=3154521 RepID=UPI00332F258B